VLIADGQKKRWTNKKQLTVTYQNFSDNFKNRLKIVTESIDNRSKHKYKHPLADTLPSYSDIHELKFHAEQQLF